jgi:hypothetical protein
LSWREQPPYDDQPGTGREDKGTEIGVAAEPGIGLQEIEQQKPNRIVHDGEDKDTGQWRTIAGDGRHPDVKRYDAQ